jgi:GT2 family glycosyltransferase/glycosyltransferase involved in cell wall biosynthesis
VAHELNPGGAPGAACDVIVPVFNGLEAVQRCLASLERHTAPAHRIVLVDDASADARIAPLLAEFARRRPGTTVLANASNLGFPGAVNRALDACRADVVVLNSDTVVSAGWVEGLVRCRDSDEAIGVVCPLSNNATLLSITGIERLLRLPGGEADVDAIAACVRSASVRSYPRLPTAVGFCMLVRRGLIERAGHFDAVYGRGYGEENDLSMRAHDLGMEIACADDVYVHHAGQASFGALEGLDAARERNRSRLERRWPAYAAGVSAWWRANPLRPAMERIHAAVERAAHPGRPRVLLVIHRLLMRGGVEEHTRALIHEMRNEVTFTAALPNLQPGTWPDFLEERPAPHLRLARLNAALMTPGIRVIGTRANASDPAVEDAFRALLAGGYDIVHIHSLVGWNTLRLPRIARDRGARVVLTAHDLSLLCADFNMVTGPEDVPCGRDAARGSDGGCVACLSGKSRFESTDAPPPTAWAYLDERHAAAADAVAAADAIVCPSEYVAGRIRRGFGPGCEDRLRVIGHGVTAFPLLDVFSARPMLRVAFLGRFAVRKGADVLLEAARRLAGERIVFEVWGQFETRLEAPAHAAGLILRGQYAPDALPTILRGIDLVVVPTRLEEAFCLVVSEAQRLGIPVAASRIGAIPERLRDGENGFLLPAGDVGALVALLRRLRDDRAPLQRVAGRLREERPRTIRENAAEYLALYRELAAVERRATPLPAATGSAHATRRTLGWPRTRQATPLGDEAFDRWIARQPVETRARADIDVLRLEGAEPGLATAADVNAALAACRSTWVLVVQSGDRLSDGAQAEVARAGHEHAAATVLYFDHDSMSGRGERYDPAFKPGFSPHLLRHRPYIAGACALHRERVLARGGLRSAGWDGIVELALELAAEGVRGAVVGIRALIAHRLDLNLRDEAAPRFRAIAAADVRVSAFVRAGERPQLAVACIESLLASAPGRVGEILVDVDESRARELAAVLASRGTQGPIVPTAANGDSALAVAIAKARFDWLAVIDDRCQGFQPGWLDRLELGEPATGGVAPDLLAGGEVRPGYEVLGGGPFAVAGPPPPLAGESALRDLYGSPREVSALAPALSLWRRSAALRAIRPGELAKAGRFELAHLGLALQEAGFALTCGPGIAAEHLSIATRRNASPTEELPSIPADARWMRSRWGPRLDDDPFYHPALELTGERMCVAQGFRPPAAAAPRTPRICAIPHDPAGSGAVRVREPCEALERCGRADVLVMPEPGRRALPNALEWRRLSADVLLAHNFLDDAHLIALEEYARVSKGLRILGLDLAAMALPDPGRRIARALALCDRLVVGTEPLADAYGELAKEVHIVPDALDEVRWAGLENRPLGSVRPRVGWAGAGRHPGDLLLMEPVVRATRREIDWVLFGHCPPEIRPLAAEVHAFVPVEEYPAKLASLGLDAAVAPLADAPFNHARSNLKLLEYGVLGIPVLCSDLTPYQGSPATLIGASADDWIAAVRALAADRDRARREGIRLRDWVRAGWMLGGRLDAWSRALGMDLNP